MSSSLDEPKVLEGVQSDLDDGELGKRDDFTPDSVATASPAECRGVPLSHEGDGVVPPTIPETSPVRNQSEQDQTTEDNGIISEQAPSRPPSPPSFANIYPLSRQPTEEQYDFIESHFETREEITLLNQEIYEAMGSKALPRLDAANKAARRMWEREARKVSLLGSQPSQTAAPSSQRTGPDAPTDADQTQDGASTKAPETAAQK